MKLMVCRYTTTDWCPYVMKNDGQKEIAVIFEFEFKPFWTVTVDSVVGGSRSMCGSGLATNIQVTSGALYGFRCAALTRR